MKHISRFLLLITILLSCNKTHKIKYPITEEIIVTDTYFDTEIQDPYRWMEDDKNTKIKSWIEQQNQLTFSYLNKITYRESLKNKLKELSNYEKIGTPFKEGNYTYFYKNNGQQNQSL